MNQSLSIGRIQGIFPEYSVQSVFPRSGQGTVAKAQRLSDGSLVVIKVSHFAGGAMHEPIRATLEGDKLSKINNPYLAALVDHGVCRVDDRDVPYAITEFIDGTSLGEIFLKRNLSFDETRRLIRSIGTAIDALWQLSIVHCDINPRNIMYSSSGDFVLIDLGIAKHLDANITGVGENFGTVGYMAPEQVIGRKNLTCRVDIFALGIVAYEGLTGIHPFQRQNPRPNQRALPLSHINRPIPNDLRTAIEAMLQPQPYQRPSRGASIL